ncbi:universal stress protein [Runella sp.]|uniref:universal stress protein n=1 Tax=Runella sp. TaxID=1960881 RepID=UPI003D103382
MEAYKLDKILVPINFSKTSLNALQTGIAMAARHRAELLLVHIVVPDLVFVSHEGGILMDTGIDNYTRNATRKLNDLAHQIHRDHDINCSCSVQSGPIISTIVKTANETGVNLIVIGSSFKPGWQTFLSGSPAFAVLKYAPCPVLTVPAYKQWLNFKQILFPIRPAVSAFEKYNYARTIIQKNNAKLIIVGVLDRLRTKMFRVLDQESKYIITLLTN